MGSDDARRRMVAACSPVLVGDEAEMKQIDMRFGIIREVHNRPDDNYQPDGEYCPRCHLPTEIGIVEDRRYCTNRYCNALILEQR